MSESERRHAVCIWYPEHGWDLIDPICAESFFSMSPAGKVFKITSDLADWLSLEYGDKKFKVKKKAVREVPPLRFLVNQEVVFNGRIAVVGDVFWHFKEGRPFYFLVFDGKKSSRRYSEEELHES
jgi:hypothetical protein